LKTGNRELLIYVPHAVWPDIDSISRANNTSVPQVLRRLVIEALAHRRALPQYQAERGLTEAA